MRRRALALAGVTAVLAASTAGAATTRVVIGDNFFVRDGGRPTVRVAAGDTVRWVWRGENIHNVSVLRGPVKFHSGFKRRGSFRRTLTHPGTYIVYCSVHGYPEQWMRLVVR